MKTTKNFARCAALASLTCLLLVASSATAQVPQVLPYQGFLTLSNGSPVDGTVDLSFRLYDNSDDVLEDAVWSEVHEGVIVQDGVFYLYLGQETEILELFSDGATRYLGISVDDDAEAEPRHNLGSVPYALLAGNALLLDGRDVNFFASQQDIENFITEADVTNIINNNIDTDAFVSVETFNELQREVNTLRESLNTLRETVEGLQNGACTVAQNNDGATVTCGETSAEIFDGEDGNNGNNGQDGQDGDNGQDGTSCSVTQNNDGATITCTDNTTATVTNGQDGNNGNGGAANIAGPTAVTNIQGGYQANGVSGLDAINFRCNQAFGGSHNCTSSEVMEAYTAGNFNNTSFPANAQFWLAGGSNSARFGNDTINSSCHSMLYTSAHIGEGNTAQRFTGITPDRGVLGNAVNIKSNVNCGTQLRALCCF